MAYRRMFGEETRRRGAIGSASPAGMPAQRGQPYAPPASPGSLGVTQDVDTMNKVAALYREHQGLVVERRMWEPLWRDCATYIDPNSDDFGAETERRQGAKKGEKVFDNTAILARDRLAAAHESMLTPRNTKWHGLRSTSPEVNDRDDVQEYLQAVRDRLFAARYSPHANFASQIGAYYQQLDTFGTAGMFTDETMGVGMRYKALHLNELYIREDFQGRVCAVQRKFSLTATQAVDALKKGKFQSLPKLVIDQANDPQLKLRRNWFIHHVEKEADAGEYYEEPGERDRWPVEACYFMPDFMWLVGEGGYRTMPYSVGRYSTGPRETYGRAPGMTVLRDIQMLQEMNKTAIREAQRLADPPMFISNATGNQPFSMRPGAINPGMVDPATGRPLAIPLQSQADLNALLGLIQDRRQGINDAFLVTLFQILLERPPNMTATEALLRAQEKGVLLAPAMGRQQSEFLGPMIEREIDILTEAGEFDDLEMPDALRETGAGIEIVYEAPINRLMKTDEAVGILRTFEALQGPAQVDPGVMDVIDWEKASRVLAEANGAPASVLRDAEEIAALQQQRQQRADAESLAKTAPAVGSAIKDMAQAGAVAGNSPQTIPQVQPA